MIEDLLARGGLSLDRLRSFCLVAEAGGITKAAKGDPARQSLYSRQVKELEEFFGTELVRRKGRGIVLTAAGERLNRVARECFASLLDFKSECRGLPVEIVIGAGESIIQWLLLPRLGLLRKKLPNVRLKLLNLATTEVVRRLAEGVIDFGVVRKDAVARPLQWTSLGWMTYSLFTPKGLPVGGAGSEALSEVPLATLEGEGSFRKELAVIARRNRLRLRVEVECASFPLVARVVQAGTMAAILPSMAAVELDRVGARETKLGMLDGLRREICLAWSPRVLRIRTALERAGEVFAEAFRI